MTSPAVHLLLLLLIIISKAIGQVVEPCPVHYAACLNAGGRCLHAFYYQDRCYLERKNWATDDVKYREAKKQCDDTPGLHGQLAVLTDSFVSLYRSGTNSEHMERRDWSLFVSAERRRLVAPKGGAVDERWYWIYADGSGDVVDSSLWMNGVESKEDKESKLNYAAWTWNHTSGQLGLTAVDSHPQDGFMCHYTETPLSGAIPAAQMPPPRKKKCPMKDTLEPIATWCSKQKLAAMLNSSCMVFVEGYYRDVILECKDRAGGHLAHIYTRTDIELLMAQGVIYDPQRPLMSNDSSYRSPVIIGIEQHTDAPDFSEPSGGWYYTRYHKAKNGTLVRILDEPVMMNGPDSLWATSITGQREPDNNDRPAGADYGAEVGRISAKGLWDYADSAIGPYLCQYH